MKRTGLCHLCGRPADNTCSLCGRLVCDRDYDKARSICITHKHGRSAGPSAA